MKDKIYFLIICFTFIFNIDFNASTVELENFDSIDEWNQSGVEVTEADGVSKLAVTNEGFISNEYCYDISAEPYLSINIPQIEGNLLWDIVINADNTNFSLQSPSSNYNEFDANVDQFIYPLKGYMIQNIKTVPSCYTVIINFKGNGTISLDTLSSLTFDQEKQYQFIQNGADVGNMQMSGDSSLDIDTLKNDVDPSQQLTKEHHWVVYPYSRLAIYPSQTLETVDEELNLSVSSFYGVNDKGTYKASPLLTDFSKVAVDGEEALSVDTYWLPYKIGIDAQYGSGSLEVSDYFINIDTIGRQILNNTSQSIEIEIDNTDLGNWTNEEDKFLFESNDSINKFYYTMTFKQPYDLAETKNGYSLKFEAGKDVDLALGFATEEQGVGYAIDNANIIETTDSTVLISNTKNYWQSILQIVPTPKNFGFESDQGNISAEEHKVLYYSAWTYLIGNTMTSTSETGYQFGQQLLGKASLQTEGAPISSGNNSWESVLQLQLITLINPTFSEDALYGFLSMVDANGELDGEVLPTRLAQTIWITYKSTGNIQFLENVYPSLKRFMDYKSENLHWIWGSTNVEDEIDSEFVISWLFDATYMQKIATELGYEEEVNYWQTIYDRLLSNYYSYFFVDSNSLEGQGAFPSSSNGVRTDGHPADKTSQGIWQRYYKDHFNLDGSNMHNNVRGALPENVHMILSALVIKDLDQEHLDHLLELFDTVYASNLTLSGFTNYKYAPNSLLMYGLMQRGMNNEFDTLIANDLHKAFDVWTFCELFAYDSDIPQGTLPTSFSLNLIIENTMMLNGVSYYEGEVKEIR